MLSGKLIVDIYKNLGIDLCPNIEEVHPSLILPNDKIYIVSFPKDKPIKLVVENNSSSQIVEKYHLTLKEVLKDILNGDWKLRSTLTRQQIRTEKGKIRRGYYEEVINFLHKRGISREYIKNEVAMVRERIVIGIKCNVSKDVLDGNKFGVIDVDQYYRERNK